VMKGRKKISQKQGPRGGENSAKIRGTPKARAKKILARRPIGGAISLLEVNLGRPGAKARLFWPSLPGPLKPWGWVRSPISRTFFNQPNRAQNSLGPAPLGQRENSPPGVPTARLPTSWLKHLQVASRRPPPSPLGRAKSSIGLSQLVGKVTQPPSSGSKATLELEQPLRDSARFLAVEFLCQASSSTMGTSQPLSEPAGRQRF